ncbi:hypothetical protein ACAW74_00250 [Fibrella sp. WM1]|uniref:hypothetical protein n=1 Tax=Fibrella musci TaxID=3242485 RepID=UPI0035224C7B
MDEPGFTKLAISRKDSLLWLQADIRRDHTIFGYKQPDTTSQKLILLSVFTTNVKGNPYRCVYGAYYESADMTDRQLKLLSLTDSFAKTLLIADGKTIDTLYVGKEWVMWER